MKWSAKIVGIAGVVSLLFVIFIAAAEFSRAHSSIRKTSIGGWREFARSLIVLALCSLLVLSIAVLHIGLGWQLISISFATVPIYWLMFYMGLRIMGAMSSKILLSLGAVMALFAALSEFLFKYFITEILYYDKVFGSVSGVFLAALWIRILWYIYFVGFGLVSEDKAKGH